MIDISAYPTGLRAISEERNNDCTIRTAYIERPETRVTLRFQDRLFRPNYTRFVALPRSLYLIRAATSYDGREWISNQGMERVFLDRPFGSFEQETYYCNSPLALSYFVCCERPYTDDYGHDQIDRPTSEDFAEICHENLRRFSSDAFKSSYDGPLLSELERLAREGFKPGEPFEVLRREASRTKEFLSVRGELLFSNLT